MNESLECVQLCLPLIFNINKFSLSLHHYNLFFLYLSFWKKKLTPPLFHNIITIILNLSHYSSHKTHAQKCERSSGCAAEKVGEMKTPTDHLFFLFNWVNNDVEGKIKKICKRIFTCVHIRSQSDIPTLRVFVKFQQFQQKHVDVFVFTCER